MKGRDIKEIVKTAVSLFLICAFAAGLVALVNSVTEPTINENAALTANEAKRALLPEAETFSEVSLSDGGTAAVGTTADGRISGYVFTTSATGYNGKVEIMTGFTPEGEITGISFLTLDETPGLGMNAKRPDFYTQFSGKKDTLQVIKNADPGENQILAITSATITSTAVTTAVNTARAYFNELTGKEDGKNE